MRNTSIIALTTVLACISGCSTYSAARYSVNTDNVVALRTLAGKTINVGSFTSTKPGEKEIMCRGVGPIKTPDGEPFSEFIRKALVDEMKIANVYSATAPLTLSGNVDALDFSSASGGWNMTLTVRSSNGRSMAVTEQYSFTTSFYGETACNQTANAFVPAVQNLVGKVVRSADFLALVN